MMIGRVPGGAAGGGKRVVVSSLTGERLDWDEDADREGGAPTPARPTADDERITRDIPPHWGTGR